MTHFSEAAGGLVVPAGVITGNDFDSDGDIVTVVLVAGPAEGTLTLAADGSFTYTSTVRSVVMTSSRITSPTEH
jgi:hypothetical protein